MDLFEQSIVIYDPVISLSPPHPPPGSVLGTRDIWFGSGSSDPYLWLMDPDPDQTPDPTLLSSVTLKMQKKKFPLFFSYNLPTGTLSLVLKFNFLLKFCTKILFFQALFQYAQQFFENREGSVSIPLTNGSGSGRPKSMRILRIWIPNIAQSRLFAEMVHLNRGAWDLTCRMVGDIWVKNYLVKCLALIAERENGLRLLRCL